MGETLRATLLAFIQGLTEFLPISSSAHLILPSQLLGWPDQGLAFDVAVHVGTLLAVMFYYRSDLVQMALAWGRSLTGGGASEDSRMVWYLGFATVPAGVVGLAGGDFIELFFFFICQPTSTHTKACNECPVHYQVGVAADGRSKMSVT